MARTIPYTAMIEKLDSVIASAIDELEGDRDIALELDVITDNEADEVQDLLEKLEEIRGVINGA